MPFATRRTILDAFLNVVFYMPLGAAAFVVLRRGPVAFIVALAFGTLVSFAVELAQLSIPTRFGNLTDLVSNSAGTLLGIAVVILATSPPVASRLRVLYSPSVLLVGLWAVWQAFLFLPRYGPAINISHVIVGFAVLALALVPWKIRAATPVLLIWLAVEELRPFQFRSPPATVLVAPFPKLVRGRGRLLLRDVFRKTVPLHCDLMRGTKVGHAMDLGAGRARRDPGRRGIRQTYLPGRTPESTDLFLLAAGAMLLYLTEPSRWDNKVQS